MPIYPGNQTIPAANITAQIMSIMVLQVPFWTGAKANHIDRKIKVILFISLILLQKQEEVRVKSYPINT